MLRDTLETVRASASAKEITLATHFEHDVGSVTVDATRLHQIVWNLLTNAVKFTSRGGRVELAAHRTASQVMICVTDTGEGIDPRFLPHMFEPFRQAETPSTRVHGGLGLGLSIVRYLVEAHGGSVVAESEGRGKGSRFTVSLPVRPIRINETPAQTSQSSSASQEPTVLVRENLNGRTVLVVDDDREGREVVAAVLRQAGAQVIAVDSAPAALEAIRSQTPDLIVTDIAMPEMDGYALRRRLREIPHLAGTPVVALTAFPASAVSVNEKEFDAYLRKPIDPFELTEKLDALLKPA
jgi:CheY-like chemotaxis protein/anti-sigma regulatory factor (Ser/Thr protein kinase)